MEGQINNFENALAKIVSQRETEKTRQDQLESKDDVTRLRELLRKEKHTIEEVKEAMGFTAGNELKKSNLDDFERVVFGKFRQRAEDHASVLIEHLEQTRAFSALDIDDSSDEKLKASWDLVAYFLNGNVPLNEEEKKEYIQFQAIRKISERKIVEEHRKNVNDYSYLNRSSLGLNGKGLDYFAGEKKEFKYNAPLNEVPKEHLRTN